jgi:tetrahydromethanopterin S-methyltransferase subunit G
VIEWWREPFFQVGLPVILTFVAATWYQGKRLDDLGKRIDDLRIGVNGRIDDLGKRIDDLGKRIDDLRGEMTRGFEAVNRRIDETIKRLDHIEAKLDGHAERIAKLEERTGPISRGR